MTGIALADSCGQRIPIQSSEAMKEGTMQKIRIVGDDTRYLTLAVLLVVRQLFSVMFIIASAGHFTPSTIASAAQQGVPMPGLLVPMSGLIALVGGLSVLFGYRAKFGAWLLVLFLVPVTLMMHNFWAVSDPMTFQLQLTLFIRNVVLLGGALLFAFFGAGPLSLDALMARPVVQLEYRDGEQLTEAASQLAIR
jgi:putative oxidoreductase